MFYRRVITENRGKSVVRCYTYGDGFIVYWISDFKRSISFVILAKYTT